MHVGSVGRVALCPGATGTQRVVPAPDSARCGTVTGAPRGPWATATAAGGDDAPITATATAPEGASSLTEPTDSSVTRGGPRGLVFRPPPGRAATTCRGAGSRVMPGVLNPAAEPPPPAASSAVARGGLAPPQPSAHPAPGEAISHARAAPLRDWRALGKRGDKRGRAAIRRSPLRLVGVPESHCPTDRSECQHVIDAPRTIVRIRHTIREWHSNSYCCSNHTACA